jgi:nicotinamide mononucleotide adenylyltransferase
MNKQRIDLRIRSEQEFAKAVLEEDARLHEERVAQALGFETIEAQEAFAREAEVFAAKMEMRAQQFAEELAIELGYKDTRDQALQEMEESHQQAMIAARFRGNGLAQKAMMDLRKFEEAQGAQKVNVLLQQAMQLTAGLASNSKTMFNINKALSLASAVMNTAEGVTKALSKQDYAGAAFIAAAGAAQIATISSTQFGGASSGLTSSGPGTGIPSASNSLFEAPTVNAQDRNNSTIRIEITGGSDSDIARAIIKSARVVNDEEDDLIFSSRSRQALEFAS